VACLLRYPEWFELFPGDGEQAASSLRQYEAEIIPGLVQSPAYAKEAIKRGRIKDLSPEVAEKKARSADCCGSGSSRER